MADILPFPAKPDGKEPMDDVTVCTITVTGKGDVSLWLNDYLETPEQFNWLVAKIVGAASSVNGEKAAILAGS